MGETIRHVKTLHGWMGRAERPDRVMFVVTTDGLENSSQTYTHRQIKSMIETQRKEHDWEFIFLGANMDAVREADHLGISPSRAARYHADEKGTRMNFQSLDDAIDDFRANGKIDENWSEKISSYANKKHHDT
jgi:hypothetical protein